jgi:FtsP/CotA-like multicopper oxidase with cupredoxin domain
MAIISTAFAVSSLNLSSASAMDNSRVKMVGGHAGGYSMIETTGDVLDPLTQVSGESAVTDPMKYLRSFNYGRVSTLADGTTVREYTLIASDDKVAEISPGIHYNVWTFNGTIPGPTLRATEGDLIKITLINNGSKPHSLHTHGIHPAEMDGAFDFVGPGGRFTYEFYANQFGVFPYHCHVPPLEEHIGHGLYGAYIIDPKTPRQPADEMIMVMNGYDTDFDKENNFYAVNGVPYYYMNTPIEVEKDKLVRVYLVNMLEFDPINNFHLHGNLYQLYRSGTSLVPDEYTDMVTMSQGERAMLEFTYNYTGKYMFHAHKTEFAEKGWMGAFMVKDSTSIADNASNKTEAYGGGS